MTSWGPSVIVRGCRRCGAAFRTRRGAVREHCTTQCLAWEIEEARAMLRTKSQDRRWTSRQMHQELLNRTPLHVLYLGMMAVLTWAQERRPSYERWAK